MLVTRPQDSVEYWHPKCYLIFVVIRVTLRISIGKYIKAVYHYIVNAANCRGLYRTEGECRQIEMDRVDLRYTIPKGSFRRSLAYLRMGMTKGSIRVAMATITRKCYTYLWLVALGPFTTPVSLSKL